MPSGDGTGSTRLRTGTDQWPSVASSLLVAAKVKARIPRMAPPASASSSAVAVNRGTLADGGSTRVSRCDTSPRRAAPRRGATMNRCIVNVSRDAAAGGHAATAPTTAPRQERVPRRSGSAPWPDPYPTPGGDASAVPSASPCRRPACTRTHAPVAGESAHLCHRAGSALSVPSCTRGPCLGPRAPQPVSSGDRRRLEQQAPPAPDCLLGDAPRSWADHHPVLPSVIPAVHRVHRCTGSRRLRHVNGSHAAKATLDEARLLLQQM